MAQVVSHAAATFHQLHLLLVNLDDSTVAVGGTVLTNHEAVAQRCHLEIVADTRHRAALRHDVAEVAHQLEQLLFAQRVRVLAFNTSNLACQTMVHIVGCLLKEVAETVFQRILRAPYASRQLIAMEIHFRCFLCLFLCVNLLFHFGIRLKLRVYNFMFVTPLRSVFLSETKSSAKVRHISDMCKFLEKIIYQQ